MSGDQNSASVVVLALLLLSTPLRGDTAAPSVRANDLGTPTAVAVDANGVEEPTTVALSRFGVTHQVTAFIRRVSVPPAVFHVRDEWVYRGSNGATGGGQFALPTGYTESSDRVLVASGSGQVYAVGRVMNRDAVDNSSTNPASIRVWQSGDGGATFPGTGSEVDMLPAGATRTVDKPWIAVSPGGTVYVAWVRVDLRGNGQSQIVFRRSRNGVARAHVCCGRSATWDDVVAVSPPGDVTGPQIVIDSAGFVSVLWTDFGARQLRIARSLHPAATPEPDASTAFEFTQTVATFNRIGAGPTANSIAGGIRVLPLASAAYNAATNTIFVAWSDGEADQSPHTDVRVAAALSGPAMTFNSMTLPGLTLPNTDQFTPVVGVDAAGNILLAYYDRPDAATTDYQETAIDLTPAGAFVAQRTVGPLCRSAIVGEYQSVSRAASAVRGQWRLVWACSDADALSDGGRVIYQIDE